MSDNEDFILNGFNYGPKKPDGQYTRYPTDPDTGKPFVRPVRSSYKHVGIRPQHPTRDLTPDEHERYGQYGYVVYEPYPDGDGASGRFWTKDMLESGCGTITSMGSSLAETYAQNPSYYGSTFCAGCGEHFAVEQFVWVENGHATTERVGS